MSRRVAAGVAGATATRAARGSILQRLNEATWPTPRYRRAASRSGRAGGPSPAPGLAYRKNPGSGMRRAATACRAADPASSVIQLGEGISARSAEAGASAEPTPPGSNTKEDHLPCIPRAPPTGPRTALRPGTGGVYSLAFPVPRHSILSVHAAKCPAGARRWRRGKAGPPPRPWLRAAWRAGPLRARPSPAAATVHMFAAGPGRPTR